ncbi:MAG: zincin-like metallopeptidase domain-containing protein [Pseudobdellovibrionaceae bacterium]|nr:zincin-like metallopeptidase domain-containing protein [Pseudobdellovibrionaceae bacterium]
MRRSFCIFNVDQIDGLEVPKPAVIEKPEGELLRRIRSLAEAYRSTGIRYEHGGQQAMYVPGPDVVRMPPYEQFYTEGGYVATLAHELVHSTGHSSRLDRFTQNDEMFPDGLKARAFEELVAEIGSAFLGADLGVDGEYENHASYLESWLTVLRSDKNFIFRAASQGAKAHSYLAQFLVSQEGETDNQMVAPVSDYSSLSIEVSSVV